MLAERLILFEKYNAHSSGTQWIVHILIPIGVPHAPSVRDSERNQYNARIVQASSSSLLYTQVWHNSKRESSQRAVSEANWPTGIFYFARRASIESCLDLGEETLWWCCRKNRTSRTYVNIFGPCYIFHALPSVSGVSKSGLVLKHSPLDVSLDSR